MQSPLEILFIDDHPGLLEGISSLISQKAPQLHFSLADSTKKAFSILQNTPSISVLIVDLNLDGEDGLSSVSSLRTLKASLPVIVYTMYSDLFHIKSALKANVQGYVTKNSSVQELISAILTVSGGGSFFCSEVTSLLKPVIATPNEKGDMSETEMLFINYKELSKSEKALFVLLAEKKDTAQIACEIGKSEKTVLNKRTAIYQKLNIRDRLELVEAARILGVIA